MKPTQKTLYDAAATALAAPSIFNTQPWSWTVHEDRAELRADRSRQLASVDPDGRLLMVSCGAAAHHALVAVTVHQAEVELLPDPQEPDLLAVLRLGQAETAGARSETLRLAIPARRTDRRPFLKTPIEHRVLDRLSAACTRYGAHLHLVEWNQLSTLALAAVAAGALQLSDPEYRMELADWTHRPPWSGDGVPVSTAVKPGPRRVPVRDFVPFGGEAMPHGLDNDYGAIYGIIHTGTDTARDWLTAGMSLSAVLLTGTAAGLGSAVISDVTEPQAIREHLRRLLAFGYPQVAVRLGHSQPGAVPAAPRRPANEVITVARADEARTSRP